MTEFHYCPQVLCSEKYTTYRIESLQNIVAKSQTMTEGDFTEERILG